MFAALSADKKSLIMSVANATDAEQKFDLSITGSKLGGASKAWQMTAPTPKAYNKVGEPAEISVKETSMGNAPSSITIPPYSVTLYQLAIE